MEERVVDAGVDAERGVARDRAEARVAAVDLGERNIELDCKVVTAVSPVKVVAVVVANPITFVVIVRQLA